MKAIVRVLKTPASARALLTYCYRERQRDDDASRAEVSVVEGFVANGAGAFLRDAELDAEVLRSRCPTGKREVAHVVISAERDAPGVEGNLLRAGHAWVKVYAPGRSYVLVVHKRDKDCAHPHCHILAERYSERGVALRFSRQDVRDMVGMKFTNEFQSVRPDASPSPHRGASNTYPAARRLVARDLARRFVEGETDWDRIQKEKVFVPGRVDREGRLASFSYAGQRLRVATVQKLIDRERSLRAQRVAGDMGKRAGQSLFSLGDELSDAVSETEAVAQAKSSPGRSR